MVHTFGRPYLLRRIGLPVAAVFLVGGCGGGVALPAHDGGATTSTQATSAAGVALDVTGSEYSFTPTVLKASAGRTTIRFTNRGAMEHDFTIKALGIHLVAQPGHSAEASVTLKPGTYLSLCSVPGHTQSGMHGTLTVS